MHADQDHAPGTRLYLDDAAARLGVSPLSLRAHWRRWGIPANKTWPDNRLWWTAPQLDAWLETRAESC